MIYVITFIILIPILYTLSLCKMAAKKQPPVVATTFREHETNIHNMTVSASASLQQHTAESLEIEPGLQISA